MYGEILWLFSLSIDASLLFLEMLAAFEGSQTWREKEQNYCFLPKNKNISCL